MVIAMVIGTGSADPGSLAKIFPNLYDTSLVLPERCSIAPLIRTYSVAVSRDKQPWKEACMHVTRPPGAHGRSMAGSTQLRISPYRAAGAFYGSTQSRSRSRCLGNVQFDH